MIKRIAVLGVFFSAWLLGGCSGSDAELKVAPLGDRAVLEALAESWKGISEAKVGVSPSQLAGDQRRHFLGEVFADAGYDYSKTLYAMAANGVDKNNKLHNDMVDLVLMPHRNQRVQIDPADIYSMDELKAVAAIERALK
ncbi:hypothetical protein ACFL2V_20475 [Pseudomonadota bacterium]